MKILIDTNIILDVLLKREPFCKAAVEVLELTKMNNVQEYISASAVTDVYYVVKRQLKDKELTRKLIKKLLSIVSVAGVSEQEINEALKLEWNDFEDSVQYSVAFLQGMDAIITRNVNDYKEADIPVWQPELALEKIQSRR